MLAQRPSGLEQLCQILDVATGKWVARDRQCCTLSTTALEKLVRSAVYNSNIINCVGAMFHLSNCKKADLYARIVD